MTAFLQEGVKNYLKIVDVINGRTPKRRALKLRFALPAMGATHNDKRNVEIICYIDVATMVVERGPGPLFWLGSAMGGEVKVGRW